MFTRSELGSRATEIKNNFEKRKKEKKKKRAKEKRFPRHAWPRFPKGPRRARFEYVWTRLQAHGRLTRTTGQLKAARSVAFQLFHRPPRHFSPMHHAARPRAHTQLQRRFVRVYLLHYVATYDRRMHHQPRYPSTRATLALSTSFCICFFN